MKFFIFICEKLVRIHDVLEAPERAIVHHGQSKQADLALARWPRSADYPARCAALGATRYNVGRQIGQSATGPSW